MSPSFKNLQSLRTNCLLAVFLPVIFSAAGCIAVGHWHRYEHSQTEINNAQLMMRAYIAGLGHPNETTNRQEPLRALRSMEHQWAGLAQVVLEGDGTVHELHRIGQLNINYELVPPELTWAVASPQSWCLGPERIGVAAPWLDEHGATTSVIYGEAMHHHHNHLLWYYATALMVLILGGGLGFYLIRRVYLPVQALTKQAQAAIRGENVSINYQSSETQELSKAISNLSAVFPQAHDSHTDRPS